MQALQEALTKSKTRHVAYKLEQERLAMNPERRAAWRRLHRTAIAPTVKVEEKHEVEETGDTSPPVCYPAVTYRTPSHLIKQRLITYNRESTLMPLIRMAVQQSLEFGQGHILGFDMDYIENELCAELAPHAFPLVLQVVQYQFAGDIHQTGGLRSISSKVVQSSLSTNTLDQVNVFAIG